MAQWLRLHAPNAGGLDSIPGQGAKSHMHATTKSSHVTTKAPACHNEGVSEPQLRPNANKQTNKKNRITSETDSCVARHLVHDKGSTTNQWGKG